MTIVPDTKDWTWVLHRPCPECGLDVGEVSMAAVPGLIRKNAASWQSVLAAPGAARRPRSQVWSALEYGCHVRDVFVLFAERLHLMVSQDDPLFANWDQDETAITDGYGEQDPAVVAVQLAEAAERIAVAFEQVPSDAWQRTGRRSDGATFTVESFARYFVHDPVHHLHDVR